MLKLTPQEQTIVNILSDRQWHCGSIFLDNFIKDDRKRISDLNKKGYEILGKTCDGRCGKIHTSKLYMRIMIKEPETGGKIQPSGEISEDKGQTTALDEKRPIRANFAKEVAKVEIVFERNN